MTDIVSGAGSLSTYGLYFIVAVLAAVVVFLYKRVSDLEKELRENLKTNADVTSRAAAETAKLLAETTEALKDNTTAFNGFQTTLADLKTTVQLAMERMKQ